MLAFYRFIVGFLFWISFPILLAIVLLTGRHRRGLRERLGFYEPSSADVQAKARKRVWIHAASIGEVRAAGVLIGCLRPRLKSWDFLVTTMTIHGRDFAREHLGSEVVCHLAPLDVPYCVNRALSYLSADIYVCLETELWPTLIGTLRKRGIPAVLINGRLSARSISTYRRFSFLFAPVLQSFQSIGAISEEDRQRFIEVGANPDAVMVTGNIKDDSRLPQEPDQIAAKWSEILGITSKMDVFIAGSSHSPEEELLLPLLIDFTGDNAVAIIAPRHIDRLPSIESLLSEQGVEFDRLSELKQGRRRTQALVVVDTFGDLGQLYSVATFVFVGGSLSGSGGHNVMEPAIWERVVFFGPDMADFREAAAKLENCGGGFKVENPDDLGKKMFWLMEDRDRLRYAQKRAGEAARDQQGVAERQAALILESLVKINQAEQ